MAVNIYSMDRKQDGGVHRGNKMAVPIGESKMAAPTRRSDRMWQDRKQDGGDHRGKQIWRRRSVVRGGPT